MLRFHHTHSSIYPHQINLSRRRFAICFSSDVQVSPLQQWQQKHQKNGPNTMKALYGNSSINNIIICYLNPNDDTTSVLYLRLAAQVTNPFKLKLKLVALNVLFCGSISPTCFGIFTEKCPYENWVKMLHWNQWKFLTGEFHLIFTTVEILTLLIQILTQINSLNLRALLA